MSRNATYEKPSQRISNAEANSVDCEFKARKLELAIVVSGSYLTTTNKTIIRKVNPIIQRDCLVINSVVRKMIAIMMVAAIMI